MTSTKKPRRMARAPIAADGSVAERANAVATVLQPTKQNLVLALLGQTGGVPVSAIAEATGWQAHTVRAALTGLRKKGHTIVRSKVEGASRYTIAPEAAQ